jgi:hypothetical protein
MGEELRYWDGDSWRSYLKNDVLPLYGSTLTILGLWRELRDRVHGKLLSEVIKGIPSLEQVFVGGTSPPEKYEEDSLALAYKELLGTSIKLREYYFLKQLGKEPKTPCTVEPTLIVSYVDHISVLLERVLARACELNLLTQSDVQNIRESSRGAVEEILKEPIKILEKFVDFLNKALSFTIAYNEYTRLVWYLRKIPRKYMRELYPKLLEPEVFKFIQEFLGLNEYIVPQVDDPEIVDSYTIYSFDHAVKGSEISGAHGRIWGNVDGMRFDNVSEYLRGEELPPTHEPYKSIGGCLCRVNELVWGFFRRCRRELEFVISGEIPDPFEEWQKAIGNPAISYYMLELDYPNSYEALSKLDENIPIILVGGAELIKGDRKLYIISRW